MPKKMIALAKVSNHLATAMNLYDLLLRNNYFLPDRKSTIISRSWLEGVMRGIWTVPKCWQVKVRNCAVFPPKKEIIQELQRMLNSDLGITPRRQPDAQWCMWVIASIDDTHPYFAKDYLPDRIQNCSSGDARMIDDQQNLFEGLPHWQPEKVRRGVRVLFGDDDVEKKKIDQMTKRLDVLAKKIEVAKKGKQPKNQGVRFGQNLQQHIQRNPTNQHQRSPINSRQSSGLNSQRKSHANADQQARKVQRRQQENAQSRSDNVQIGQPGQRINSLLTATNQPSSGTANQLGASSSSPDKIIDSSSHREQHRGTGPSSGAKRNFTSCFNNMTMHSSGKKRDINDMKPPKFDRRQMPGPRMVSYNMISTSPHQTLHLQQHLNPASASASGITQLTNNTSVQNSFNPGSNQKLKAAGNDNDPLDNRIEQLAKQVNEQNPQPKHPMELNDDEPDTGTQQQLVDKNDEWESNEGDDVGSQIRDTQNEKELGEVSYGKSEGDEQNTTGLANRQFEPAAQGYSNNSDPQRAQIGSPQEQKQPEPQQQLPVPQQLPNQEFNAAMEARKQEQIRQLLEQQEKEQMQLLAQQQIQQEQQLREQQSLNGGQQLDPQPSEQQQQRMLQEQQQLVEKQMLEQQELAQAQEIEQLQMEEEQIENQQRQIVSFETDQIHPDQLAHLRELQRQQEQQEQEMQDEMERQQIEQAQFEQTQIEQAQAFAQQDQEAKMQAQAQAEGGMPYRLKSTGSMKGKTPGTMHLDEEQDYDDEDDDDGDGDGDGDEDDEKYSQ